MKITIVGSGAWGTALAISLCKNNHAVTLLARSAEKAAQIKETRQNPRLKGVTLPQELEISADAACVAGSRLVVIACPSVAIRPVCRGIVEYLDENAVMVSVTKGIEPDTLLRMSQVVEEETNRPVVALTGPSHAEELACAMPTGCVAACADQTLAELVQDVFMSESFRIYTSPDIVGAELGGALKNVIALCTGITDGMGYGDNSKAMLMTRGLTEMTRLGVAMGANRETFAGLTGIGDLIVTCTSAHSRNRQAGMYIGQGSGIEEGMEKVGAVVEGYYAARSAAALAKKYGVEMPIVRAACAVLYEDYPAELAVDRLLHRSKKTEPEDSGWN